MQVDQQHETSGIPAPYGRACTNCSRAKCRCIYRSEGGACERCHRLNKDCRPSIPVRRRNAKKITGSKTAQLEEKLGDLVSLLRAQAEGKAVTGSSSISQTAQSPLATSTGTPNAADSDTRSSIAPTTQGHGFNDSTTAVSSAFSTQPGWEALIHTDIPESTAEQNLSLFREKYVKWFPFVYIPDSTTSSELRHQRPFLWFCIMSVTSKSLGTQLALGRRLHEIISQKVVMEGERSIDLLLGMICHFGWPHPHKLSGKSYFSLWLQIAVALVCDLALNRAPPPDLGQLCFKTFWSQKRPTFPQERTLEQKRAVLSVYVISVETCNMLKRLDQMQWTPYMDECLRDLVEHAEWEGDHILATQVRCHLIRSQVLGAYEVSIGNTEYDVLNFPAPYFVKALHAQLQEVRRCVPAELKQNEVILMYIHSTALAILENEVLRPPVDQKTQRLQRVDNLWACVRTIQDWFDVYFAQSVEASAAITFAVFWQLSHCFIVLYRLTTLEDPSWDTSMVRQTVDAVALLEKFASNLDAVPSVTGLQGSPQFIAEQSIFKKAANSMRLMIAKWRKELDGDSSIAGPEPLLGPDGQLTSFAGDGVDDDFLNQQWLTDMFVVWDTQP